MKKQDLINIIASIKDGFSQDELAYYACTSKAETTLRDAISYQLHLQYFKDYSVLREWKLIDLAILKGNSYPKLSPVVLSSIYSETDPKKLKSIFSKHYLNTYRKIDPEILIEFKAHSSIDYPDFLLDPQRGIPMAKDISDMYNLANATTEMYFIFFNTVYDIQLAPTTPGGINIINKYPKEVLTNIHMSYIQKVSETFNNWERLLNSLFLPSKLTSAIVEIKAGMYYDIPVSVIAFVYGPFRKSNFKKTVLSSSTSDYDFFNGLSLEIDIEDSEIDETIYRYEDKRLDGLKLK